MNIRSKDTDFLLNCEKVRFPPCGTPLPSLPITHSDNCNTLYRKRRLKKIKRRKNFTNRRLNHNETAKEFLNTNLL